MPLRPIRFARILLAAVAILVSELAGAYGASQFDWQSSAIPNQVFPSKQAALAATKALGGGYALLDKEDGSTSVNTQWASYKYSVSPRPNIPSPYTYHTGSYSHPSEAAAYAFIYAWIAENYSAPECPPQLNPVSGWYGMEHSQTKEFNEITYLFGDNGCVVWWDLGYYMQRTLTYSCPALFYMSSGECRNDTVATIRRHPLACVAATPNPCDVGNGSKSLVEPDYRGLNLSFERYYQSGEPMALARLGVGWSHSYSARLAVLSGQPSALIRATGNQEPVIARFTNVNGTWLTRWDSITGSGIRVEQQGAEFIAYLNDGSREAYSSAGRLLRTISASGLTTTVSYDSHGQITTVSVPYGHQLAFGYDSAGRLASMTNPGGGITSYAYDAAGNLASVTHPDSTSRTYLYEDTNFPNHLTGLLDEGNSRLKTASYDTSGRVVSSLLGSGAEQVTLTYGTTGTTVQKANGSQLVYSFTTDTSRPRIVTSTIEQGLTNQWQVPSPGTDPLRRPTQITDARGIVTKFTYNEDQRTGVTEAFGTPRARTTTYQYIDARRDLPTQIDEYGKRTTRTYDSNGNVLTNTVTDLLSTPNVSRTWTYTYTTYGQLLAIDGPRTDVSDVTTYTYYACTYGSECGQVHTVADALNHVTTFNSYNAHGRPLTITDGNNIVTTLTYDAMQRLTSRTVGTETTTFEYWPTGLTKKVTLPNGMYLQYGYDDAHRLTSIEDGEGNRTEYTLDGMSNRTGESTYDPSDALARTRTQVFNTLNQLWKVVGAAGTATVTTVYQYDNNGNTTSVGAPLGRDTGQQYDELNRLKQITDALNGVISYGYDAAGNVLSVTDARSLVTSYTYNGFGELTQLVSPDTGTTVSTYDSSGNLATRTDARSRTAAYGYDALNRMTSQAYPDLTTTFTYDAGTNGNGRLTGASDANHSLSYNYDAQGQVTQKAQTVGVLTKSVSYEHTNGDLTSLVTPSGQSIAYAYTAGRVSSITLNGSTTILSDVLYEPFGPVRGWTWGSGAVEARVYDLDGNLTDLESGGGASYAYDDAFRIVGVTDLGDSARSWTYGYDILDRLTSASRSLQTIGFTYDANGNRLTQSGTSAGTYSVSGASNRLISVTGAPSKSYSYDDAGNVTSDGTHTFTYNDAGRLVSVAQGALTTTYVYNALGQRVRKSSGSTSRHFVYDEAGRILGEYDTSGNLIQETIWLGDIPVATLRPNGGGGVSLYYVHTDHLNTPRRVSRSNDNVVVWRWDSDPFGTDAAIEDPDGDTVTFAYNLRLPGQYFDAESGTHYNYFRDYDPYAGRYLEPDPLGIKGGLNLYGYANQAPTMYSDPTGEVPLDLPCQALRWKVILLCKTIKRRCEQSDSCEDLQRKVIVHLACAVAQSQLTAKCYPNDPTHRQRISDTLSGAERCSRIWDSKPECKTCGP